MAPEALKVLGKYELLALLGSGAYAEVYRARDTRLKHIVALKLLKPALIADDDALHRFLLEAQVACDLFHTNIATVLDLGETEGRVFLAMRFIDGPSLAQRLKDKGAISWDEALEITCQVGSALAFAHAKGLVHRDVKPANILLGSEGAVLTDFGLVRAMEAGSNLTRTGSFIGTPQYMPPEVWQGQPAGPSADQYALACVLVEMLTGKALFDAPTPPAVMLSHFQPRNLHIQWPKEAPEGLGEVLDKALAQQPQERYEDIQQFLLALAPPPSVKPIEVITADKTPTSVISEQNPTSEESPSHLNNHPEKPIHISDDIPPIKEVADILSPITQGEQHLDSKIFMQPEPGNPAIKNNQSNNNTLIAAIGLLGLAIIAIVWILIANQNKSAAANVSATGIGPTSVISTMVSPTNVSATGVSPTNVSASTKSGAKQWSSAPAMTIDKTKQYFATVKMAKGSEFTIQLFPDKAPITVNSFVFLARQGFYDGVTFHRVLEGFMAQGGDPTGTGTGGPGYEFVNENSDLTFDKAGVVAMANAGADTNGSQFFITFGPQTSLNGGYTIFGQVTSGMDVVNGLTRRDPEQNPTFTGDVMQSVTITEK
jgi:serine/threonine protein kinase/cyclophilin family peptidyl-prolyl cis-trans isomerase